MYALYDSAINAFMTPFFVVNDGAAIRSISDAVNSEQENNLKNHPEQFTLFRLGEYNDKNATVEMEQAPKQVAAAVELINDNKPRYSNIDMEKLYEVIEKLKKAVEKEIKPLELVKSEHLKTEDS